MKVVTFFLFLISTNLFAFPEEGDYARYLAKLDSDTYELKKSILEHDKINDNFVVITKLTKNDVIQYEVISTQKKMWFYTPEKVSSTLKSCLKRGGMNEDYDFKGSFIEACTFYNEDAQLDYTIGMVPFGLLRFQEYWGQGRFLDFILVDI